MKQRLFVAIGIPDNLKQSIALWQKQKTDLPVRFVAPKNLHLTIIPPWYADPKYVITRLQDYSPTTKPFTIHFDKIEPGPDIRRPRLVWVKGKSSKALTTLKKEIARFLRIKTDHRALVPHVTLVRFKHMEKIVPEESVKWSMRVASFILMKSTLSSKGASYEVLSEFSLKK